MNTPSPLIPQGSLQNQTRGGQNVRIAVFTIVALHAVIFVGLLMQGCHRGGEEPQAEAVSQTSPTDSKEDSNYYPPIEEQYYSDYRQLTNEALSNPAAETVNGAGTNTAGPITATEQTRVVTNQTVTATNNSPATGGALTGVAGRQERVERTTPAAPSKERTHEIEKGDMLGQLANTYNVSLQQLVNANPGIDPRRLRIGQKIKIPASSPQEERTPAISADGGKDVHVVKKGENLSVIAAKHGTTVPALKSANNLATDLIRVDQKLVIPLASSNSVTR